MLKSKKLTPYVNSVEDPLITGCGATRNSGQGHGLAQIFSERHFSKHRVVLRKKKKDFEQSINQSRKKKKNKH